MDINETPAPRRWKSAVAGAVTGGLLAASIAVPGTWALTRDEETPAPVSVTTTTTAAAAATEPDTTRASSSSTRR